MGKRKVKEVSMKMSGFLGSNILQEIFTDEGGDIAQQMFGSCFPYRRQEQ